MFLDEFSGSFKHCGAALHVSGTLDFIWNYRVVDTMHVHDAIVDGYVEDIDVDFGYIYYKVVKFETEGIIQDIQDGNTQKFKELC